MKNDPRSHGLWEKTAPPGPVTTPLSGDVTVDVAIVGGGFTGCSAALHLAQAGVKAVVLEATEVGFGASGRNVGLVNAGMWVMPKDIEKELGPDYGNRILTALGAGPAKVWEIIARHNIACEATPNGTLHCAVGDEGFQELEERCAQWAARGAPVTLLTAAEAERRIGSRAYQGALLDMRAGTIQPLAYVRGLAQAAISAGAVIHSASPVTGADEQGGKWVVSTPQGRLFADWVIVATDAYTGLPWRGIRQEQVHLPYFNFSTVPLSPALRENILPGREGCWDTKEILSSFRYDANGRLIVGSCGALRGTGTAIHRAWAQRTLAKVFPQIGPIDFDTEWYGQIGMTSNNLPRFHRLARNVVSFSGYNGRGIAPGTVFGHVLADHVMGRVPEKDLPLPVTVLEPDSLRGFKELYYETGAQLAHLAGDRF